MNSINKILEISSSALGYDIHSLPDGIDVSLLRLLSYKNGFFAFENSLEVFPCGESFLSYPLHKWNDEALWRGAYENLAPIGICFAQDAFGGQFVFSDYIYTFDPETGGVEEFAINLEEWADNVLNDYEISTGYPVAHKWQSEHGRIAPRNRLVPIKPFVLGGEFKIDNLVQMDAVKSLKLRGSLAQQIQNAPDGSNIIYEVTE